jgi:hypothetical protein
MSTPIVEPTTWLANVLLGTLRQWMADGPFVDKLYLTQKDLDHLQSTLDHLAEAHRDTVNHLVRQGIDVKEYPVRIGVDTEPQKSLKLKDQSQFSVKFKDYLDS